MSEFERLAGDKVFTTLVLRAGIVVYTQDLAVYIVNIAFVVEPVRGKCDVAQFLFVLDLFHAHFVSSKLCIVERIIKSGFDVDSVFHACIILSFNSYGSECLILFFAYLSRFHLAAIYFMSG